MISIGEFVNSYNNLKITGENIKRLNELNMRQYSNLGQKTLENGDITIFRNLNATDAKFYTKTKNGDYIVKKQYGHKTILVGRFPDDATAQMIVSKCKLVNWDINKISHIIEKNKVKPKKLHSCKWILYCRKEIW